MADPTIKKAFLSNWSIVSGKLAYADCVYTGLVPLNAVLKLGVGPTLS